MSGTETPGGDREGMVTVRGHDQAYLGCMGTETWKWLLDHPEMDAPALDRLVARNQQLQEALAELEAAVQDVSGALNFYIGPGARRRVRDAAKAARAALASVPESDSQGCRRCRDTQEALEHADSCAYVRSSRALATLDSDRPAEPCDCGLADETKGTLQ